MLPCDPDEFSSRLLAWYGREGRDLPWRRTRDPYRIWLSEVMLQQTGVETVIPYYERFLRAFPDVAALAATPVEKVIELWAGLGYYSRARNLHAAAARVVDEHGGSIPDTLEGLMTLPGVGRSTAGAILSIAFDRRGVILDGNVRRVLCRLFALQEQPRSTPAEKKLWRWAEILTPEERPHDYAQGIMDLGATVCAPRRPDCLRCPVAELCRARALGLEQELPMRRVRREVPVRTHFALLLERDGRYLVRRRPLSGMLAGLWEFPGAPAPEGLDPERAAADLLQKMGMHGTPRLAGEVDHAYSHFRLELYLYYVNAPQALCVAEAAESRWLTGAELAECPLHGAHKKALKTVIG